MSEEIQEGVQYMIDELTDVLRKQLLVDIENKIDLFIFSLKRSIKLEFKRA